MLKKGRAYTARNGNVGIYKGHWMTTASGIFYILEDENGRTVGFISKKSLQKKINKF